MKLKRALLLVFFLIAGAVIGALVATVCTDVPFLSWLSFSRTIGISPGSPLVLDLSVLQFSFGMSVSVSVAQILVIGICIIIYAIIMKKSRP